MVMMLIGVLVMGAGVYHWSASRKKTVTVWVDPNHQHLAALLLVSTSAFDDRNKDLYQAAIKEIVYIMSEERWKRLEIEWRMRQALRIAKQDSTPEIFEKVNCVAQNIARVTVHSAKALPWERRPVGRLVAPSP
jgi:hypothetical protein